MEGWPDAKRYDYFKKEGLSLILKHPLIYTKIMLNGVFLLLVAPGDTEFLAYVVIRDHNEKSVP